MSNDPNENNKWIYNTDDYTPKLRCPVCKYNKPIISCETQSRNQSITAQTVAVK